MRDKTLRYSLLPAFRAFSAGRAGRDGLMRLMILRWIFNAPWTTGLTAGGLGMRKPRRWRMKHRWETKGGWSSSSPRGQGEECAPLALSGLRLPCCQNDRVVDRDSVRLVDQVVIAGIIAAE